jgi:sporulation protein YlmC with PRC-barrel domain
MSRTLELSTTVTSGDYDGFKAAFSRSVLGVTFKKFKRRGKTFFDVRTHNEEFTKKAFEFIYLNLKEELTELNKYNLRANYTLEWDNNGKIIGIKDLSAHIYLPVGNFVADRLDLKSKEEFIKMDLFYSDFDAGSINVRSSLQKIINEMGSEKFRLSEHNIMKEEGKKAAEVFDVKIVPTLQIDETKLVNPSEKQIKDEIVKSLDQKIIPTEARFIYEVESETIIKQLAKR